MSVTVSHKPSTVVSSEELIKSPMTLFLDDKYIQTIRLVFRGIAAIWFWGLFYERQ
jgi:hypothetical protein